MNDQVLRDFAVYKTLGVVRRGGVSFGLKCREDLNYYTMAWRASRPVSGTNRRFYREQNVFWNMDLEAALEIMDEAHSRGLFADKYARWPNSQIQVLDSKDIDSRQKSILKNETLTTDAADAEWLACGDLRVVVCCEPETWIWRKIMIYSENLGRITFRSTTRATDYRHAYSNAQLSGGWRLDKSMMDADVVISRIHFETLRKDLRGN
jgi:hypothetical protein